MKYKRIAIIGNAGSGKSSVTMQLHNITGLPVYHLDQYYWLANWVKRDPEEYEKLHKELCDKDAWIMDGVNLKLIPYRIEKADCVIFLDVSRFVCLYRIIKRTLLNYGSVRASSAPRCPEKFNLRYVKFLAWVWNFNKKYKPTVLELFDCYKDKKKVYIIQSNEDLEKFFKEFK
jgi:adenylate kinase family enzyme